MAIRNWLRKNMGLICTMMLGLNYMHRLANYSTILFGEPEFPEAD